MRCLFYLGLASFLAFPVWGDDNDVRIGALFSLSGWASVGGQAEYAAIQLAAEDINNQGGIGGKQVKLVLEDTRSDFPATITAFNKLADVEKLPVVLGPNWAEFSEIVAPLAQAKKIVLLTPSGFSESLTKGRDFVFSLSQSNLLRTRPLAERIADDRNKRVFILRSAAAYTEGVANALRAQLLNSGLSVENYEQVNPGTTDFRSLLTRIKSKKPDAVVAFLLEGGDLPVFIRQFREQQLSARLYTNDFLFDPSIRQQPQLAEGVTFYRYISQAPDDFIKRFTARFKTDPVVSSEKAYDALFLIKRAIEQCGYQAAAIRDCLRQQVSTGLSGEISFGADNLLRFQKPESVIYKVENGNLKRLD